MVVRTSALGPISGGKDECWDLSVVVRTSALGPISGGKDECPGTYQWW